MPKSAHGSVDQSHLNRKTDYLFRLSLKALILDRSGRVLVVKEADRTWWDLPGGGMDHDEDFKTALKRELKEEINLTGDFKFRIISFDEPHFLELAKVWQVRLIFEVVPTSPSFTPGADSGEIAFIDPGSLKDSAIVAERKVYEHFLTLKDYKQQV